MQWAKLPRPTTKVNIQMIMTDPVIECDPETSQATVAMIQPPMTALQKMVADGLWMASRPNWARDCTMSGRRALVRAASAAKAKAPRMLAGKTVAQRRRAFHKG